MANPSLDYSRITSSNQNEALKKGGSGGNSGDMEARIKRLEDDMKEIRGDLKTLLRDVSEVKGKIGNMPTTWQTVGIVGSMLALALAGAGAMLGLVKFLQP